MAKKAAVLFFWGILFVFRTEAAMVSFLVIETGMPQEEGIRRHSEYWENALMDVFFEAGHIVCNAPLMRLYAKLPGDLPQEAVKELNDARDGGVDFFIVTFLDYETGARIPREISLRLFTINPQKKIFEQRISGKSYRSVKEETDDLRFIARGLVPRLNTR